jgi:hypothetical protein
MVANNLVRARHDISTRPVKSKLLCAVIIRVMLAGLFGVMCGVDRMTVSHMCVVPGLVMIARFVMIGGGSVMLCSMLMMLSGFAVVVCCFFGHSYGLPPRSKIQETHYVQITNQ